MSGRKKREDRVELLAGSEASIREIGMWSSKSGSTATRLRCQASRFGGKSLSSFTPSAPAIAWATLTRGSLVRPDTMP